MAASLRGHAGSFVLLVVLLLVTVSADEQHELIRVKRFEGDVARNVDNYDKDQPVGGLLQKNQVNANVIQPSQRDGLKQNPDGQMPALKKPELQGQGYKPVQEQKMPWKPLGGLPAARNEIPQGAQEQLNGKLAIPGAQRRDPIRPQSRTGQVRIIDFPACQDVVTALCAQNARGNNFAVLECLQNDKQNYENIPPTCQQFLWEYKRNLTLDVRFDSATFEVCKEALDKQIECQTYEKGKGQIIPCLIEHKDNITNQQCRQYLTKMASIIFSDYHLIQGFYEKCEADISAYKCGTIDQGKGENHQQGKVINCLQRHADELNSDCKHQILRIAEFSADDYHQDRALFFACRNDRERFCEKLTSGNGKVYKCLMKHKFEHDMSEACRDKLTIRQRLAAQDYKISYKLQKTCHQDIKKYHCEYQHIKQKESKLSFILLCLENQVKKGHAINSECQGEIFDTRKSLMEDYMINPDIILSCRTEIDTNCNGLQREGKTLHCLMGLLQQANKLGQFCMRSVERLIKETDAGEDYRIDTALQRACQPVVDTACKKLQAGDAAVLSCLMEHLYTSAMVPDCQKQLLELQYFVSRDFRLDPRLYKMCNNDAVTLCHAPDDWANADAGVSEEDDSLGPGVIFACLHRYLHPSPGEQKLSRQCSAEVHRVLRQRADNVRLNPHIEAMCRVALGEFCSENVNSGEEMDCLQQNYEKLDGKCKALIQNFTTEESEDIKLDRLLMRACEPMLNRFCKDVLTQDQDEGNLMQCLIEHKNDHDMNTGCASGIEHFQLLQMKDYKFSYKFKEACKSDVLKFCKGIKSKAEVVSCLSSLVLNDTLRNQDNQVSETCRKELRFELLQKGENIKFDQELFKGCEEDIKKLCQNVQFGNARVLECLKEKKNSLTDLCHVKIFNRQKMESKDPEMDYTFMRVCKRMIKQFCPDSNPKDVFRCLKNHKNEPAMEQKCKMVITRRQITKNTDYRLKPELQKACSKDVPKFCAEELKSKSKSEDEFQGIIIECLKIKYREHRLSQDCEGQIRITMQDAAMDYRLDAQLKQACGKTIIRLCPDELDQPGGGRVEECLKAKLNSDGITDEVCRKHVIRLLQEGKADIHVDPVLYKSCALDIKHFCAGIPPGEGRQMSCLLEALEDKSVRLNEECRHMLTQRVEMWEYAAKVAPPETVADLMQQIQMSPSRNYYIIILLCVVGSLFIGGLFCGRATKRIKAELKNK